MGKAKKVAVEPPKVVESLYLRGRDAAKLRSKRPGEKVRLVITGTVTQVGINTYGARERTATVEVKTVTRPKRKGGR